MNEFTGFNPEQAKRDLEQFHQATTEIYNYGREKFEEYNRRMVEAWTSPKAQEYSDAIVGRGAVIGYEIAALDDFVLNNAIQSIQQLASANRTGFNYYYSPLMDEYISEPLKDKNVLGTVGMNISIVEASVSEFGNAVNTICDRLESLPTNLAVYDSTNSLALAFANLIKSKVNIIHNEFNTIINAINTLKDQEVEIVNTGTRNAADTLSSGV